MTAGPKFRIGLLRLTDAAPLIVAKELDYFAGVGLDVALSIEPSWANIADKLAYGLLDGALLPPPLAVALHIGLSGSNGPERIIVPASLSLDGNSVILAERWGAAILGGAAAVEPMPSALETARRFADAADPISGQPELKATPIRMAPVASRWHGLLLRGSERPPPQSAYY